PGEARRQMTAEPISRYWFWPDRKRSAERANRYWDNHRRAATASGFAFECITADDVEMVSTTTDSRVYVAGRLVNCRSAVFHDKLYTWPMFQVDSWRYLSLFQRIRNAEYCTLVPPALNLTTNDK